jgi:zinc D-Ala-D-Ala dipeptidase
MILLSDPSVASVPAVDDGDPLVDLRDVPELRLDRRQADEHGAYAHLRSAVVERLLAAQATLPGWLRLLVVEGYRPLDTQRAIFSGYREELRRIHPSWSPERLHVETSKFAAPVPVAPHSTGGAVDLTLCTAGGVELDMGTVIDATPEASDNACFTGARNISAEARHNRRVLGDALRDAGLVNYPTEWWHWSYGDRYWALISGSGRACFGPVELAAAVRAPATPRGADLWHSPARSGREP